MNQKRTLFMMFFFVMLLCIINLFAVLSVNSDVAELNSLIRSDYEYSVISKVPIEHDSYYIFDVGISFETTADSSNSIYADVVMQTESTEYTGMVQWNGRRLKDNEISISDSISRLYGLNVGDRLFSTHIVDGKKNEYVIQQIIPEKRNCRIMAGKAYYDGIIIMGYDDKYTDNISYSCLIFTEDPIYKLDIGKSGTAEQILYRVDEIRCVLKRSIPLVMVFAVFGTCVLLFATILFEKGIKQNFRRQILLGFDYHALNRAYNKNVVLNALIIITFSFILSTFIEESCLKLSKEIIIVQIIISFAELIVLMISSQMIKVRLWRK